jgi:hypothetical protein
MNGGVQDNQMPGIGSHLMNPPVNSGGGSISQLSAGISIQNFNDAPRKKIYKNSDIQDMALTSANKM